ncbi:MAG: hypothetical protein JWN84_1380 [Nocardioides sp.]|nr:hypothetical protein [Nocardioides sp.]
MSHLPSVAIDPPLDAGEVAFIAAFAGASGDRVVRRVWPGQPTRRCPWTPSADGRFLELDETSTLTDPASAVSWLRFLSREFLAPSTEASLDAALTEGLRCGHRVTGEVVLRDDRRISVDMARVTEEVLVPDADAVVLDLQGRLRVDVPSMPQTER